ncbi:hypothetical protein OH799_33005 [Nocardia sp. NBC_00881]|uniref:hypothetical protein n=1 Tax=Nocardia sp. NBC_00881 TaxID=2975995 RepID=UPI003868D7E0|nr:hypothetical protein OH799_33005 [Nocardia sp. NBC_00881]
MNAYTIRLDGSESTGPAGIYLVWTYGWSDLEVEEHDSLEDALSWFAVMSDSVHTSPKCIEGPAGIVPEREVEAWVAATGKRSRARQSAYRDTLAGQVRHVVELRFPGSDAAADFDECDDLGDALSIVGRINRRCRVRVVSKVFDLHRGWVPERVVIDWDQAAREAA